MRHGSKLKKLGRDSSHREAMFRNMLTSLVRYERIQTTLPKAKEARRFAERLVGFAKKNTLAGRRMAGRTIADKDVLKKLFDVVGPRFTDRDGGYTRIYRLGPREGDGAEMALLELVVREETHKEKKAKAAGAKASGRKPGRSKKTTDADKEAKEKKPPRKRGKKKNE
ncbi:MAG: 50S ribosomal protein L17 [candidate division WOR-3 bacterium]|nr:MAG: 50S ribosomal protein L17 [candidate division WOR-3 bacterium]